MASGAKRGIQSFLSGNSAGDDARFQNGRKVRAKEEPVRKIVEFKSERVQVFQGTHAAEDPRWVMILEVKANGTKRYRCVACPWERTCKIGVVVKHLMRVSGAGAEVCSKLPTTEMSEKLSRFLDAAPSASTALSTAVNEVSICGPDAGRAPELLQAGASVRGCRPGTCEADLHV